MIVHRSLRAFSPLTAKRLLYFSEPLRFQDSFVYSLLMLNFLVWLPLVEKTYSVPLILKYLISAFCYFSFVRYWAFNNTTSLGPKGLRILILLFFSWSIYLLLTSFRNELLYIQEIFAARYFFAPYLLPLVVLASSFNIAFFRKLLQVSIWFVGLSIIVELYLIFFSGLDRRVWYEHLHRIWLFDLGNSLLLLVVHLFERRWLTFSAYLYFVLLLLISSFYGSRSIVIECIILLAFAGLIHLKSTVIDFLGKVKYLIAALVFVIMMLILFDSLKDNLYVFQKGFDEQAFENSRGAVFRDFFLDFRSAQDWLFGRGLNGTILRTVSKDDNVGNVIENGFLYVLLKGGMLYLLPMLVLLLWSAYLGFVHSSNDLSKALAALTVTFVVVMFAFNLPDFSSKYVLIWVAASTNFQSNIRRATNQEVRLLLSRKLAVRRKGTFPDRS